MHQVGKKDYNYTRMHGQQYIKILYVRLCEKLYCLPICTQMCYAQIFQYFRSYLKILGVRRTTESKYHTEDPKLLGTTLQTLSSHGDLAPGMGPPLSYLAF